MNNPRYDAYEKVTGKARFSADCILPDMLHACVLWAPVPGIRIDRIDVSQAEKSPGVVRIFTRKDIHGPNIGGQVGMLYFDHPVLVGEGETANNICDSIALIAAESEDQARRAAKLVRIEYTQMPVTHTVEEAEQNGEAPGCSFEESRGNTDEVFSKADLVVSEEYFAPYLEHIYLETESGCAYRDENNIIHIIAGTQDTLQQHHITCNALNIPYNKLELQLPYIGGAFGGKHSMAVHAHLALMAQYLDRPVQLVWSREESISYSCKKQQTYIKHSIAFDKEGHILGMRSRIKGECSPYLEKTKGRIQNLRKSIFGMYKYPAFDLKACMYKTTGPEVGAFRGVAHPDGIYVVETLMDKAARALHMDAMELRRKNMVRSESDFLDQYDDSKNMVTAPHWEMDRVIEEAFEKAGPAPISEGKLLRGRGFSCCAAYYGLAQIDTQRGYIADIMIQFDGTITVDSAIPEVGQGITSVIRNIIRDELYIAPEKIIVYAYRGSRMPFGIPLGGSQGTGAAGVALMKGIRSLKEKMEKAAVECTGLPRGTKLYFNGKNFENDVRESVLGWREFAFWCEKKGVSLKTSVAADDSHPDVYGRKPVAPVCCIADVEVNSDTGAVKILQLVTSHDIGKVMQYDAAAGQFYGSAVMCVGQTFMEEFIIKEGRPMTNSLSTYLVPTSMDIPEKNIVHFIEGNPDRFTAYGAKGIGEHGMYNTPAALANAVSNAIGKTVTSLPITPEKVLRVLEKIQ